MILRNRDSPVLQEEGNPNRTNDSSASRVYESQSAFSWLLKVLLGKIFPVAQSLEDGWS